MNKLKKIIQLIYDENLLHDYENGKIDFTHFSSRLKTAYKKLKKKKTILRPAVQQFAVQMELTLRDNDHKSGWKSYSDEFLIGKIGEEVSELILTKDYIEGPGSHSPAQEAIDVANFAMMFWDNYITRLKEKKS